jgi:hypothetical protein
MTAFLYSAALKTRHQTPLLRNKLLPAACVSFAYESFAFHLLQSAFGRRAGRGDLPAGQRLLAAAIDGADKPAGGSGFRR